MEIQYKFTDKSFIVRGGWRQASLCVRQSCVHVAELSVRRILGRTGGTVGRAGVGWRAGLLLVLRCAVRLQRRHRRWRVLALGRAAFAAEQLAFDFPEVVAVVKSEREGWGWEKYCYLNQNLPLSYTRGQKKKPFLAGSLHVTTEWDRCNKICVRLYDIRPVAIWLSVVVLDCRQPEITVYRGLYATPLI